MYVTSAISLKVMSVYLSTQVSITSVIEFVESELDYTFIFNSMWCLFADLTLVEIGLSHQN